jgi:predicted RNA-binding protein YlxR (DUF448 family)
MKNEIGKFTTPDFYLSAFCLAKGLRLKTIDKSNPHRAFFVFEDSKDRQGLVEDFLFGRAFVEPKSFATAIKELKQLLHSTNL